MITPEIADTRILHGLQFVINVTTLQNKVSTGPSMESLKVLIVTLVGAERVQSVDV